jgi:hypothetical protein
MLSGVDVDALCWTNCLAHVAGNTLEEAVVTASEPVPTPPAWRNSPFFFWVLNCHNVLLANDVAEEVTHRLFQSNSNSWDV